MGISTFFWSLMGALVIAGLGFGGKKIVNKFKIKNSQFQNGNNNIGINKSKNVQVTVGSDYNAKKNDEENNEDKK